MWRIGVEVEDKAKKLKVKDATKKKTVQPNKQFADKKLVMRKIAELEYPVPKPKRGSVVAAEHLLMRRTSRGRKQSKDNISPLNSSLSIASDFRSSAQDVRRLSLETPRLRKIREVQARINQVIFF